jgi:hypothetical protein
MNGNLEDVVLVMIWCSPIENKRLKLSELTDSFELFGLSKDEEAGLTQSWPWLRARNSINPPRSPSFLNSWKSERSSGEGRKRDAARQQQESASGIRTLRKRSNRDT